MPQRIAAGTATPISVIFYAPGTETATDCDSATNVTCAITHANGSTILASTNATHVGATGSGTYQATVPAQANPAEGTITWQGTFGGATRTLTDSLSVVGSFYAELAEIRALDGIGNTPNAATVYPTALLAAKRDAAEVMFEQATGKVWTLRYARDILDGDPKYRRAFMPVDQWPYPTLSRRLALTHEDPVALLAVLIDNQDGNGLVADARVPLGSFYTLYPGGEIERALTDPGWPRALDNVAVEYTFGMQGLPADLKAAFLYYVRHLILHTNSRLSDRATSIQTEQGLVQLGSASGWVRPTGLSEVDAVLERYGARTPVIG